MSNTYDVLIRDAQVYDGEGRPPRNTDVAVESDRIARTGNLDGCTAKLDIDASGLALSPGFIDVHTHDDFAALYHPDMGFKSRGGVTTCIVGNCGFGAAPFSEAVNMLGRLTPGPALTPYEGHAGYVTALESIKPGVNIGVLAGHGTIHKAAVGSVEEELTDVEMSAMKGLLREALNAELAAAGKAPVSRHSVNRYSARVQAGGEKMREAREAARAWAQTTGQIDGGEIDAYLVELVRTRALDHLLEAGASAEDQSSVQDLSQLALSIRRLIDSQEKADKRIERKLAAAADKMASVAKKQGLTADTVAALRAALASTA